eukprot:gene9831-11484_t
MGDSSIILNVLNLVDKRLNRLKGAPTITRLHITSTIEHYQKTKEILNNAKKLQSRDPQGDSEEIRHNIVQIDVRLNLASQEESLLLKRLAENDYQGDADAFILKHNLARSGSEIMSVSQIIQPFLHTNEPIPSYSSSLSLTSLLSSSHQKISQKLKMAKQIPIRKASEARIGHARTNSTTPRQEPAMSAVNDTMSLRGQGERLALLQSLLKAEELTNNAERKVMDEINKVTRQKSQELYQLVWEVRNLDKAIAHILCNRLQIQDVSSMTNFPDETDTSLVELSTSLKLSIERLVIIMRTEPSVLAETLSRAGYLGDDADRSLKSSHTDLSQAIVFSLFGNCFTASDERLLLLLIRKIATLEFDRVADKRKFGTQEPFSFTLLSTYLKYTFGKPYIISVLKDLVVSIIQDHNMNLENDPQKKAMLAEIGLDEDFGSHVDQNTLLQQFSGEFLQRVMSLSTGMPYGLRWIAKAIVQLWRDHLKATRPDFVETEFSRIKDIAVERELIIHLVFENFFIPALIRTDHFGVLPGLTISHKTRHNLIQIAKMVLTFLSNPSSIPKWLNESMNLEERLNEYFNEITLVEEPDTYYNRKPEPDAVSETLDLQLEMTDMIKNVQPASQLQEGMKFLVINVIPKQKEEVENRLSQMNGHAVRLAKENLVLALCVFNFLCGYTSTTICELLLLQCGRSRSLELNILEAQIEETIRSLWALPEHYKANDYEPLIDGMFEDYNRRERKRNTEKQLKVLYLDQLQRHTSQIISQKNINMEFLTNQKFRLFRDKTYARMQTEFVSEFMSRFSVTTSGNCSCLPSLNEEDTIVCDTCGLKSTMIGTFSVSQEDVKFTKELKSKSSSLDHKSLYIPEKYANQSPWELAQQEIRKINLYKSPHDKMKCIIDTWNIIFNYTKPLGESGPDDFLPIMGFVIIKARPESLLSNIQYISLYTTEMDPTSEVWFMNLKSSIEVIKEVLIGALNFNGWTNGILTESFSLLEFLCNRSLLMNK